MPAGTVDKAEDLLTRYLSCSNQLLCVYVIHAVWLA